MLSYFKFHYRCLVYLLKYISDDKEDLKTYLSHTNNISNSNQHLLTTLDIKSIQKHLSKTEICAIIAKIFTSIINLANSDSMSYENQNTQLFGIDIYNFNDPTVVIFFKYFCLLIHYLSRGNETIQTLFHDLNICQNICSLCEILLTLVIYIYIYIYII